MTLTISLFRRPCITLAALLTLAAPVALANNSWTYRDTLEGDLSQDRVQTFRLTLFDGYEYVFEGACDRDCRDLDLVLKNAYGDVVDSDSLDDDEPLVFSDYIDGTDTYYLEVHMERCSNNPCHFDIDFSRR